MVTLQNTDWLSIGEAADLLQISRDTLRRWEKKGKVKAYRSPSNRRMYRRRDVQQLYQPTEFEENLTQNPQTQASETQSITPTHTPSTSSPVTTPPETTTITPTLESTEDSIQNPTETPSQQESEATTALDNSTPQQHPQPEIPAKPKPPTIYYPHMQTPPKTNLNLSSATNNPVTPAAPTTSPQQTQPEPSQTTTPPHVQDQSPAVPETSPQVPSAHTETEQSNAFQTPPTPRYSPPPTQFQPPRISPLENYTNQPQFRQSSHPSIINSTRFNPEENNAQSHSIAPNVNLIPSIPEPQSQASTSRTVVTPNEEPETNIKALKIVTGILIVILIALGIAIFAIVFSTYN